MDCDTASGLMPWLLNRTLPPAEAEAVGRHLEGCAACRGELEETRRAAAVFAAHPTAGAIVDLAWDRDPEDAVASRHVAQCAGCAEELALARDSRRAGEDAPPKPASRAPGRWIALPAALAAGLVIGLALPRPQAPSVAPVDPAVARLEAENALLRGSMEELRGQAEAARAADVNLPLFEVLSGALTRGSAGPANEIVVPKTARRVALLVVADVPAGTPASLEVRSAAGAPVWQDGGLLATPLGAYSLALPAELLPEGDYVLALRPRGAAPADYRLRVRAAP